MLYTYTEDARLHQLNQVVAQVLLVFQGDGGEPHDGVLVWVATQARHVLLEPAQGKGRRHAGGRGLLRPRMVVWSGRGGFFRLR